MSKIKKMDQILADKIAAGEVIEKCASVVKELIENAIDAGSTEIKVSLQESGIKEIKVVDNGEGMDRSDAEIAFSRHATSKILEEKDLYNINTLGFRGEALSSIASVSKVELITSTGDVGTKVIIEGGVIKDILNSNARKGTVIKINNLFYNTPARLKYLKSLQAELANTINLVNKMALSNPNIKFTLNNDDKNLLQTDGSGDLLKVIMAIYGAEVTENMLSLNYEDDDYQVLGYISKPQINRSTRNHMITIVNGRVVRNSELNKVINEAYYTYKPDNQYPIIILNIKTSPSLTDVNIHPTKQDIKFSKFSELKKGLKAEIEKVLEKKQFIPKVKNEYQQESFSFNVSEKEEIKEKEEFNKAKSENEKNTEETMPYIEPATLLFGTYIIAQNEKGMYLIDQHGANERINYEKIKSALKKEKKATIALFSPITLEYPPDEFLTLKNNFDLLRDLGFIIEEFGFNSIIIKEHPTWLPQNYETAAIKKMLDIILIKEKEFDIEKFNEKVAISLSCHLSIKANENISLPEMSQLIDDLRNCKNPYTCPHGRPTIIFYEKYELEKLFKRSGV